MRILCAISVLAVAIAAMAATSASAGKYRYMLPEQMEAQLHEYGLTWAHKRHAVLDAGCVGQGVPGPRRMTEYGVKMRTYHLFECMVTVRKVPRVDLIHVTVTRTGWAWEDIS